MADKKHAKFLEKDGEHGVKLFHGDDVEEALKGGWKEPKGQRPNGAEWNPEPEEGEVAQADAAAQVLRDNAVWNDKVAARKAKEAEDQQRLQDKAKADEPVKADLKVEVVPAQKHR